MNIINLTPHEINIIRENSIMTISSSGVVRAEMDSTCKGGVNVNGNWIGVFSNSYGKPVGLPVIEEDTIYIVSSLALSAIKEHCSEIADNFYTVNDLIRNDQGVIIGCKSLAQ